jgi:uncharacterized protein (TIGR02145 family)
MEEWEVMTTYIGGAEIEGKKLKATSGWDAKPGTDEYGFSALPGGSNSDRDVGGGWWSASENDYKFAYSRYMYYDDDHASWDDYGYKNYLFSVRCVQD